MDLLIIHMTLLCESSKFCFSTPWLSGSRISDKAIKVINYLVFHGTLTQQKEARETMILPIRRHSSFPYKTPKRGPIRPYSSPFVTICRRMGGGPWEKLNRSRIIFERYQWISHTQKPILGNKIDLSSTRFVYSTKNPPFVLALACRTVGSWTTMA